MLDLDSGILATPCAASKRRILALWFCRACRPTGLSRKRVASRLSAPLVVSHKANNALYVYALDGASAEAWPLQRPAPGQCPRHGAAAGHRAGGRTRRCRAAGADRRLVRPLHAPGQPGSAGRTVAGHHRRGASVRRRSGDADDGDWQRIAAQGFAVRGAIAGTSLAARALARHASGTIVPCRAAKREAITPLPITALDCDDKTLRALRHAGLKTVGMVAERPAQRIVGTAGQKLRHPAEDDAGRGRTAACSRAAPCPT